MLSDSQVAEWRSCLNFFVKDTDVHCQRSNESLRVLMNRPSSAPAGERGMASMRNVRSAMCKNIYSQLITTSCGDHPVEH